MHTDGLWTLEAEEKLYPISKMTQRRVWNEVFRLFISYRGSVLDPPLASDYSLSLDNYNQCHGFIHHFPAEDLCLGPYPLPLSSRLLDPNAAST